MKIIQIFKKIFQIIIVFIFWIVLLYPIYFTFKGILTTNFNILGFEFIKGIEVYFLLILIFGIVTLILLIANLLVGVIKKRKKLEFNDIQYKYENVDKLLKKTFGSKSFDDKQYLEIDKDVDFDAFNKEIKSILGGK